MNRRVSDGFIQSNRSNQCLRRLHFITISDEGQVDRALVSLKLAAMSYEEDLDDDLRMDSFGKYYQLLLAPRALFTTPTLTGLKISMIIKRKIITSAVYDLLFIVPETLW